MFGSKCLFALVCLCDEPVACLGCHTAFRRSRPIFSRRTPLIFRLPVYKRSALCVPKTSRCVRSLHSRWLLLHRSDLWTSDQALLRPLLTFLKLRPVVLGAVEERPCKNWQVRAVTFAKTKVGDFLSSSDDESPQHLRAGDLPDIPLEAPGLGQGRASQTGFQAGFFFKAWQQGAEWPLTVSSFALGFEQAAEAMGASKLSVRTKH